MAPQSTGEESMMQRLLCRMHGLGRRVPVAVAVGVLLLFAGSALAGTGLPQPIYFFTDTATPIDQQNPLVIRPHGFLMFQDGQWVLQNLRWTGWGSSVARASGISNSSNDIPNAAQGKRIKTWAWVTLWNPGRFEGHEVYRCFSLTVPAPAADMNLCLSRVGHGWLMTQAAPSLPQFLSPDRQVWCGLSNTQAFCVTGGQANSSGHTPTQRGATLSPSGRVTTCYVPVPSISATCTQNWNAAAPVLLYGRQAAFGGFLCTSRRTGITCVLAWGRHKGAGFTVSPGAAVRVG
jgi:hypothetical protein